MQWRCSTLPESGPAHNTTPPHHHTATTASTCEHTDCSTQLPCKKGRGNLDHGYLASDLGEVWYTQAHVWYTQAHTRCKSRYLHLAFVFVFQCRRINAQNRAGTALSMAQRDRDSDGGGVGGSAGAWVVLVVRAPRGSTPSSAWCDTCMVVTWSMMLFEE